MGAKNDQGRPYRDHVEQEYDRRGADLVDMFMVVQDHGDDLSRQKDKIKDRADVNNGRSTKGERSGLIPYLSFCKADFSTDVVPMKLPCQGIRAALP